MIAEYFDGFVGEKYDRLKRYCSGVMRRGNFKLEEHDFEDIFHETLIKARGKFSDELYQTGGDSENEKRFLMYFGRFFRGELRNYQRTHRRALQRGGNFSENELEKINQRDKYEEKLRRERLEEMYEAIFNLGEGYKKLILLQLEGREADEIADIVGRERRTVFNKLQIARDKIRETLISRPA